MKKSVKVFKKLGLFLLLALAVMLIVRCEKEPVLDSTYIIKATSVGIGGIVSPSTIEVAKMGKAAVALKPDSGYDVDVVKVDGNIKPVPTNLIYNFSEVVANHNMEVTWKKKVVVIMHKVEILPTTGGSVSSLTQVADGLGIDFTFTSDSGFKPDSIIVNGKSYSLTGNTYSLTNVTSDIKVKGVFKKTLSWFIMKEGEWKRDSILRRNNNDGTWIREKVWGIPGALQIAVTFLPTGKVAEYWNGIYSGDWEWSIDETTNPATLNAGGQIWKIEKLDEQSLVLARYDVACVTCPDPTDPKTFSAIKDVYSHH